MRHDFTACGLRTDGGPMLQVTNLDFTGGFVSHLDENGAGSQLHHWISCRTKHGEIQRAAATHSHSHHVDLLRQGKSNDLLVRLSNAYRCLNPEGFAFLRWNQLLESLGRCRDDLFRPRRTGVLFQHVQQRKLGVVFRRRLNRRVSLKLALNSWRNPHRKEFGSAVRVAPFTSRRCVVRQFAYSEYRARRPAHHSVGHRPQHQAVVPSPPVCSHDD